MNTSPIPTPAQVLALLQQSYGLPANREDFAQAFKVLYPNLTAEQRAELIQSILAYVDSMLSPQQAKAA